MLTTLVRRVNVILGSVITLVVGLAVAVNTFGAEVMAQLPAGWQDNAARITTAVVTVLGAAAAAIRRVTEVQPEARGILPTSPTSATPGDPFWEPTRKVRDNPQA